MIKANCSRFGLSFFHLPAVLVALLALAIPHLATAQDIEVAKTQTNAQNVAAVADAALAAGYSGANWKSLSDVIDSLSGAGITVPAINGQGAPMLFSVPALSDAEKTNIQAYLTLTTSPSVNVAYHTDARAAAPVAP